jgi:excisionase family DNA binding protein
MKRSNRATPVDPNQTGPSTGETHAGAETLAAKNRAVGTGLVEKLALSVDEVAAMLGISTRHVWKLHATQSLPLPVRLGRAVRWNRAELVAWLDAGCPSRESFDAAKQKEVVR